jgi:Tfp pilus assembly protein PilF
MVTITTPSLTNFKLTFKSDRGGKYGTILNDATLPYHVKIEKEGFLTFEADEKIAIGDTFLLQTKLVPVSAAAAKPAAGASGGGASTNEQAIQAFNSGVESLNAGDKATAETHFLEATKKTGSPQRLAALTQLAYEKKDWAKTLEYGRKATDLDPSMTNLYGMMEQAAKQSGDAKAAAEYGASSARRTRRPTRRLYNAGVAAYNKGKMKDAEASLAKAVEAKPDWADTTCWGWPPSTRTRRTWPRSTREVPRARADRQGSGDREGDPALAEVGQPFAPPVGAERRPYRAIARREGACWTLSSSRSAAASGAPRRAGDRTRPAVLGARSAASSGARGARSPERRPEPVLDELEIVGNLHDEMNLQAASHPEPGCNLL